MTGVTIVGDFEITTGVMEAGRGLIKTLVSAGVDVAIHSVRTDIASSTTRRLHNLDRLPRGRLHDIEIWLLNINEFGAIPNPLLRPAGHDPYIIASWFWEFP